MKFKSKFLNKHIQDDFEVIPLAYGMSFRTYDRVCLADKSYVLMNVPVNQPLEDGQCAVKGVIEPFLKVYDYLKLLNIKVPEVFEVNKRLGKVLLEDLGDETFYDIFSKAPIDIEKYQKAIDVLVTLYKSDALQGVDSYSEPLATVRGDFFLDDYLPAITGQESTEAQYAELHEILKEIYKVVVDVKWGTILWDYHSPNLMQVNSEVGVLDFQDAKYGPLSYDLASLLYDARFPFPSQERDLLFNYFIKCVDLKDVQSFKDSFEMAGLLRNLGVLGRFARAAHRDGKVEFLPKIAVLWPYIDEALCNPKAQGLKIFLNKYMSNERLLAS